MDTKVSRTAGADGWKQVTWDAGVLGEVKRNNNSWIARTPDGALKIGFGLQREAAQWLLSESLASPEAVETARDMVADEWNEVYFKDELIGHIMKIGDTWRVRDQSRREHIAFADPESALSKLKERAGV